MTKNSDHDGAKNPPRQATHSKEPWSACSASKGKCRCGQIWSNSEDHPVATVVLGKWGDNYPSLRFVNGDSEGSIGAKVEAYDDMIEYGEVPEESAFANAHRIVACVNACQGIQNPAAIPQLVEALRQIKEMAGGRSDTIGLTAYKALVALDKPVPDAQQTATLSGEYKNPHHTRRSKASRQALQYRPLSGVLKEIASYHTKADKVCGFAITFRYDHSAQKMSWGELNISKIRNREVCLSPKRCKPNAFRRKPKAEPAR